MSSGQSGTAAQSGGQTGGQSSAPPGVLMVVVMLVCALLLVALLVALFCLLKRGSRRFALPFTHGTSSHLDADTEHTKTSTL